jgi:hypothetical protein
VRAREGCYVGGVADRSDSRARAAGAVIVALCLSCAGSRAQPAPGAPTPPASSHGYALLFELLSQEKSLSRLLAVHSERPDLNAQIEAIAEVCGAAHERLEELAEADPSLDLEDPGLPTAEVETRESIKKARIKVLLSESGEEFELQLLLAQNEALTYALHLTEVLARAEPDPARLAFVRALWRDLQRVHAGVMDLLRERYRWTPPQD